MNKYLLWLTLFVVSCVDGGGSDSGSEVQGIDKSGTWELRASEPFICTRLNSNGDVFVTNSSTLGNNQSWRQVIKGNDAEYTVASTGCTHRISYKLIVTNDTVSVKNQSVSSTPSPCQVTHTIQKKSGVVNIDYNYSSGQTIQDVEFETKSSSSLLHLRQKSLEEGDEKCYFVFVKT